MQSEMEWYLEKGEGDLSHNVARQMGPNRRGWKHDSSSDHPMRPAPSMSHKRHFLKSNTANSGQKSGMAGVLRETRNAEQILVFEV
jgi:hypothetical protein